MMCVIILKNIKGVYIMSHNIKITGYKSGKVVIERVGEVNTANNGQKMEIIGYRNNGDIDIKFEDGTVVSNRRYQEFQKGSIRNPNIAKVTNKKNIRLGEENVTRSGLKIKIIAYRGASDIDVQFEDGSIVTNKTYVNFKKGLIRHI